MGTICLVHGLLESGKMEKFILFFCIFGISSLLMFLILIGFANKRRINNRIKEFLPLANASGEVEKKDNEPTSFNRFFLSIAKVFRSIQFSDHTEKLLLEAGSNLKPEEFFAFRFLSAIGIGILLGLLGTPWYFLIVSVVIGFLFPKTYLRQKRKKRLAFINYQLIEVLGMMANSMRAGFSFLQAMQLVGKEVPDPLGPEFDRVVRQTGLGIPLEDVFKELVERLPNNELEIVVKAILAQRRSGGNLAELLETMEETVRGRIRILEELNTLTAQGRMSSWIITLIPVGLGFYLSIVNREFFAPMLEHPLGWVMLSAAAISTTIGWMLIQRIIRIEV
jgi:tight adherence protein B